MWTLYPLYLASFIVCAYANCICYDSEDNGLASPLVRTPNGRLKGSLGTSRLGKIFYAFRGIRYAKPPVGDLRFQTPVPFGKWNDVYDATQDMPFCPQPGFNNTSEDCVMLNVYTSELPEGSRHPKRPVIVSIHDGGFYALGGNTLLRGPDYFIDQDIVLVSINYRLGALGFLSTGDELAPGNNGMKDQVLALKWIQENIEAFGGDKESVTLLGYSSGSWATILHMVSPMARGLFHKAICMGGSGVGPFPTRDNQLDFAKKQASILGCPIDSSKSIIDCLKTKSAEELGNSLPGFAEIGSEPILILGPVIEKDFGQERYLDAHPIELIQKGNFHKVPVIAGRTKDGFLYKGNMIVGNETARKLLDENFEKYAPIVFGYERDTKRSKELSQGIRDFYFGGKPINNETADILGEGMGDSIVGFGVDRAMKLLAKNSDKPLYYYQTTFLGDFSYVYAPGSVPPNVVVHQDELIYMFYVHGHRPFFNESYPTESRTVDKLTTLWANFARTGNPTPEITELFDNIRWEQYDLNSQKYLDFGKLMQMKKKMFEKRYAFWEKYYPISDLK